MNAQKNVAGGKKSIFHMDIYGGLLMLSNEPSRLWEMGEMRFISMRKITW